MNASPPVADRGAEQPAAKPFPWLNRLVFAHPVIVTFIVYFSLRQFILGRVPPIWFSDTDGYVAQFRDGFALGFLGRTRPWAYPLFLWLTGYHYGLAVWVQRIAGAAAWFALARAAAGLYRPAILRRFVFYALLILSLTLFAIQWDVMLLSESLTISCFLLLGAAWFRLLHAAGAGLRWLAAMAALAFPLAGLRDSNIPLLLLFAAAAGTLVLLRFFQKPPAARRPFRPLLAGLALAGMLAGCALLHQRDIQASRRGWGNLDNVLRERAFVKSVAGSYLIPDTENIAWLASHYDLPAGEAEARAGNSAASAPPISPRYRTWLETTGARAWTGFLLHHPGWFWSAYHGFGQYWVSVSEYAQVEPEKWHAAHLGLTSLIHNSLYGALGWFFGLRPLNSLLLLFSGLLAGLWLDSWLRLPLRRYRAPLGALFWMCAVAALAPLIAFVGDFIETWRHALLGLIALYITFPLALALLAEMVGHWPGWQKETGAGAPSVARRPAGAKPQTRRRPGRRA